jgi:hypothetical protein
MSDNDNVLDHKTSAANRCRKPLAAAVGLLLAAGIAGGGLVTASSASAAETSTPSKAAPATQGPKGPADSAVPVRPGEKAVTGTTLVTLRAAALKAVPGGTVYRVDTDADGAVYEAHMTKASGTNITVEFNKNLAVTAIQNGMGAPGPGAPGGPAGGPRPGAAGGPGGGPRLGAPGGPAGGPRPGTAPAKPAGGRGPGAPARPGSGAPPAHRPSGQ